MRKDKKAFLQSAAMGDCAVAFEAFSRMLVILPDRDYVSGMAHAMREARAGEPLDASWDAPDEMLMADLSRDRAVLIRGLTPDGPRPPYESLYRGGACSAEVLASAKGRYDRFGFRVADEVHEAVDYLGIEMLYEAALLRSADACANQETAKALMTEARDFLSGRLAPFMKSYAEEVRRYARTDFFVCYGACLGCMASEALALLGRMEVGRA